MFLLKFRISSSNVDASLPSFSTGVLVCFQGPTMSKNDFIFHIKGHFLKKKRYLILWHFTFLFFMSLINMYLLFDISNT